MHHSVKTFGRLRSLLVGFSVIALAGCVNTSSAVTTEYYSVRGSTGAQIDRELRRKGPLKGHALASAAIQFEPVSVFQEESEGKCRFKSAKFRVKANITLPRWIDRSKSGDRDLRRAWDGLSRYAKAHEQTHVRIAETFAQQLGKAIMALPPQKTCARLDRQAKKVVNRLSKAHDRAQAKFDADEQRRLARLFAEAERES